MFAGTVRPRRLSAFGGESTDNRNYAEQTRLERTKEMERTARFILAVVTFFAALCADRPQLM
jgi:hypothetical protein